MTDPQVIIDDVKRGNSFYTNLVHTEILADQAGVSNNNCDVDSQCLLFILKALEFNIDQDIFDETTEKIYRDLILIIGKYTAPTLSRFYYGIKDTSADLTVEQILASSYITAPYGSNPIIPYTPGTVPKYPWMAELSIEPTKAKWQDTVVTFNNGDIGSNQDTFSYTTIGNFRLYDTNFATQFDYPVQFKVGIPTIQNDSFPYTFSFPLD